MPLRSEDFWRALDIIARDQGLSPSALARKAGLDPTTFNRSKRGGLNGDGRWPSSSSIALVLETVDMSLIEFARLVESPEKYAEGAPLPERKTRKPAAR